MNRESHHGHFVAKELSNREAELKVKKAKRAAERDTIANNSRKACKAGNVDDGESVKDTR